MKAVVYRGSKDVRVEDVPDARIERPTDVLVRVTTTNICGSDLHMYEGRTDVEEGKVLGHENLGEVIEVGSAVDRVKVGDRVCLPFNIACGFCKNCERGFTAFCLSVNPGFAGGAYGYADMGPYSGGQAELLRVPYGDFNCLRLPPDAEEKENDYVMLADIWPTGHHATQLADVAPGDSVVVYGAGPVGLMAAYSAQLIGASKVMVVDHQSDRLALAEKIGAIPVDPRKGSPVEQVMELTGGEGADKGCECVGWQAHDPQGDEHPELTMNDLVASVRATGAIGVVGVFVPEDPKAPGELAKQGKLPFDMGLFFQKGLRMGTGQANVKAYNRQLRDLIAAGKAQPSFLVSHELPLDRAPEAYERFDRREDGWTKVVLKPAA
ncbi:glutathione-independent formaldehyde dehydrogenase [Actinoallomurus rhizosphaericola]|uniref:glutathione-independent formaldehyde dehydrogenase n=1 Tax=Actinoallomurus rhizosphaericola TaxID=2952536 RepID=UPI0020929FB3|nr:glutathione-independent formaldehyde dehydrogenase [Actinoallomurus rhizosphaericola]MCO5994871.1 glutathione-independent formaldehyde dehydrogenase [Actinoallomurus rhizosphaericola]